MKQGNLLGNTVAVIVMCLVLAAAFGRIWANQQRLEVPMIWHAVQGADGNLHVIVGDQLFIESPSGGNLDVIPLDALGIRDFNGAMLPLPTGEIVMAAGQIAAMNTEESVRRFKRETRRSNEPTDYLQRCDFDARQCELLNGDAAADTVFRPGRAFGLAQGPGDTLLATDAGVHAVYLLSMDGEILDKLESDFEFPNEIHFVNGEALVVDTNHHRLVRFAVSTTGFGEMAGAQSVLDWPGVDASHRFPFAWARTADGAEWVLIAGHNMGDAILVRSQDGRQRQIELPRGSDAVDFVAMPDRLLLVDQGLDRILSFSLDGRAQPDFGSEKLQTALAEHAERREHFQSLMDKLLGALVLIAILSLPVALIFLLKRYKREARDNLQSIDLGADSAAQAGLANLPGSLGQADSTVLLENMASRYHFVRGPIIDSRDEKRLKILMSVLFIVMAGSYVLLRFDELMRITGELKDIPPLFIMMSLAMVAGVVLAVYGYLRESLWVDPQGIHYVSPLPKPFTGLMPGWTITWREIEDIGLTYIRSARQPLMWRMLIRTTYGEEKQLRPMQWKLVGAEEPGLRLFELTRLTEGRIRKAIQQRMLYRLLATQMQRLRRKRQAA